MRPYFRGKNVPGAKHNEVNDDENNNDYDDHDDTDDDNDKEIKHCIIWESQWRDSDPTKAYW